VGWEGGLIDETGGGRGVLLGCIVSWGLIVFGGWGADGFRNSIDLLAHIDGKENLFTVVW
jgi:hypothetical protein